MRHVNAGPLFLESTDTNFSCMVTARSAINYTAAIDIKEFAGAINRAAAAGPRTGFNACAWCAHACMPARRHGLWIRRAPAAGLPGHGHPSSCLMT
jgi:hypothetical protein